MVFSPYHPLYGIWPAKQLVFYVAIFGVYYYINNFLQRLIMFNYRPEKAIFLVITMFIRASPDGTGQP